MAQIAAKRFNWSSLVFRRLWENTASGWEEDPASNDIILRSCLSSNICENGCEGLSGSFEYRAVIENTLPALVVNKPKAKLVVHVLHAGWSENGDANEGITFNAFLWFWPETSKRSEKKDGGCSFGKLSASVVCQVTDL